VIRGAGLALLIAFAACGGSEPDLPPGLGDRIPDARLEVVEAAGSDWSRGDTVWLSDLEGRPIVLDFWASWCGPCRGQHEFVSGLVEQWGEEIQVVGVLYQDSPEDARAWLAEEGATYPTVVDPGDLLAETFWIRAIPRFVLLDPEGRLAWDMMGSWAQDSVRLRLEEMAGR
jgi:cytochrome c biogenesis protein CcmG/thiol:disulfide interchange protein DsbE